MGYSNFEQVVVFGSYLDKTCFETFRLYLSAETG